MINPRSINIACNFLNPIDNEVCYNNAITLLIDNKAKNLNEISALQDAVNLANLNIDNCGQYKNCYASTDWSRYKNLQATAINNLDTANSYISDATKMIAGINNSITTLQNSQAYKNAIASGQKPATPVIDLNKQTANQITANTLKTYLTTRNVAIGIAILAGILIVVFIIKKASK